MKVIAEGLRFPEGPVALADGSVLVAEIAGGTIKRVDPDGTIALVATVGAGPTVWPWGRMAASTCATTAA